MSIPALQWKRLATPAVTLFWGYRTTVVSFQGQRLVVCRRRIRGFFPSVVSRSQRFHRSRLRRQRRLLWLQRDLAGSLQVSRLFLRWLQIKTDIILVSVAVYNYSRYLGSLKLTTFFERKFEGFCYGKCLCVLFISVCVLIMCVFWLLCRWVKQEIEISKNAHLGDSGPKLDLGFKDGQTITLNIGVRTQMFYSNSVEGRCWSHMFVWPQIVTSVNKKSYSVTFT